jgi:hypothetical protein
LRKLAFDSESSSSQSSADVQRRRQQRRRRRELTSTAHLFGGSARLSDDDESDVASSSSFEDRLSRDERAKHSDDADADVDDKHQRLIADSSDDDDDDNDDDDCENNDNVIGGGGNDENGDVDKNGNDSGGKIVAIDLTLDDDDHDDDDDDDDDDDGKHRKKRRRRVRRVRATDGDVAAQASKRNERDELAGDSVDDEDEANWSKLDEAGKQHSYELPRRLATVLRPHQHDGLEFAWQRLVGNADELPADDASGLGAVLAHAMGLGKTLTTLSLLVAVLRHQPRSRFLLIVPKRAVDVWRAEYQRWRLHRVLPLHIAETRFELADAIADWRVDGGALLLSRSTYSNVVCPNDSTALGRALCRRLAPNATNNDSIVVNTIENDTTSTTATSTTATSTTATSTTATTATATSATTTTATTTNSATTASTTTTDAPSIVDSSSTNASSTTTNDVESVAMSKQTESLLASRRALLEETDIVVIDEGHSLKNDSSQQTKAMYSIVTQRRLVLTGTPMQNSLDELFTLMDFVAPGGLGLRRLFKRYFEDALRAAVVNDARRDVVQRSRLRSHALNEQLSAHMHRVDDSVLVSTLPRRREIVLQLRLPPLSAALHNAVHAHLQSLPGPQHFVSQWVIHRVNKTSLHRNQNNLFGCCDLIVVCTSIGTIVALAHCDRYYSGVYHWRCRGGRSAGRRARLVETACSSGVAQIVVERRRR